MFILYRNVYDYGHRLYKGSIPQHSLQAARKLGRALVEVMGIYGGRWIGVEMINLSVRGVAVIYFYPNDNLRVSKRKISS